MNNDLIKANKKYYLNHHHDDMKEVWGNEVTHLGTEAKNHNHIVSYHKFEDQKRHPGYARILVVHTRKGVFGKIKNTYHDFGTYGSDNFKSLNDLNDPNYLKEDVIAENTRKITDTNVDVYASFIKAESQYNGVELNERQFVANVAKNLGIKTHTDVGHTETLDKHASQAVFGHSIDKIRNGVGDKWDVHVVGAQAKSKSGQLPTKAGKFLGQKAKAPSTEGSLFGRLTHKAAPEQHKVEFALTRDGKGGTKVAAFRHSGTGSGGSDVSVDHMINHVKGLSDKAKGYEGLEETIDPKSLIDELTYANYAHNRHASPEITPERWKKVYGNVVDRFEKIFQARNTKPHGTIQEEVLDEGYKNYQHYLKKSGWTNWHQEVLDDSKFHRRIGYDHIATLSPKEGARTIINYWKNDLNPELRDDYEKGHGDKGYDPHHPLNKPIVPKKKGWLREEDSWK